MYPSIDVMCLVGLEFSGYHEDAGLYTGEMQRLSHYVLNTGAVLDKVPKVKALMKTCENKLKAVNPPVTWDTVTQVFDEVIEAGQLPPDTMYCITKKQWIEGYDPAYPSTTGKTPTTSFHLLRRKNREMVLERRSNVLTHRHGVTMGAETPRQSQSNK